MSMKTYVNIAEVNARKSERARTRARASVCVRERVMMLEQQQVGE